MPIAERASPGACGGGMMAVLVLALSLLSVSPLSAAELAAQRFTVRDSIEMTRIVHPKIVPAAFGAPAAEVSLAPDQRHFFVVTARGDLQSDTNTYTLLLFDVERVRRAVLSSKPVDSALGASIATFVTGSTKPGIDCAKWISRGRRLAFIGRGADGIGQVYTFDLSDGQLSKWTASSADVVRFDIEPGSERLVFATEEAGEDEDRLRRGYAVTAETAIYLHRDIRNVVTRYYTQQRPGGEPHRLPIDPVRSVFGPRNIYVSPDGKRAVMALSPRRYPESWLRHDFVRARLDAGHLSLRHSASASGSSAGELVFSSFIGPDDAINQYVLFDLVAQSAQPLLDAPAFIVGTAAAYYEGTEAAWSPDSAQVLLPSTMLPTGVGHESGVFTATVNVDTREVRPLREISRISFGPGFAFSVPAVLAQWPSEHVEDKPVLEVKVVQNMSSPPELEARVRSSRRARVITNLNPQFLEREMGRVQEFRWTDRRGRELSGGLVLPPGYDARKRYPVVIQLGRFSPADFVVDGLGTFGTTAFAARALAGRDIVVVEPASLNPTPSVAGQSEGEMIVELIEDLIDALVGKQIAEAGRVGLVGFSRTGMYAQLAAAFAKRPLAAVTVADSVAMTPFCYAREFGQALPSMTQFESEWQMGSPFWGEGIGNWERRADLFHLDAIRAPIRYETNGEKVPCYWEAFAILSRMKRPTEMVHLPLADHLLVTPRMRYTSQEGNVDWLSYWLSDYVDPDPEKRAQYERWAELRARR